MKCNKCGLVNKGGGRICSSCGARMDELNIDSKNIDISGFDLVNDATEQAVITTAAKGGRLKWVVLAGVVAIGLAVAAFLPTYLAQLRATQILEVISLARSVVERHVREQGTWPISTEDTSFIMPGHSLGSTEVQIKLGVIELGISEKPGKIAKIAPTMTKKRQIVWECDSGGIGSEYLPPGCFK